MAMVNIDMASIPVAVRDEFNACESCEVIRKPRAWICDYHTGYWAGYEDGQQNGSDGGVRS